MDFDGDEFMVIQAGAAHLCVVDGEAKGFNEMQLASCVGAKAYDVSCVGWNFRFDQDNIEHRMLQSVSPVRDSVVKG